jgi:nicotinamidase-related amidase
VEQPPIPRASSAMVFHQMTEVVVRGRDEAKAKAIAASGMIDRCVRWTAELRRLGIPIFWIRVEHRADRKDRVNVITDRVINSGFALRPQSDHGSALTRNIAELPLQPEDHAMIKPRYDPFVGTDLDMQLRARHVNTIFLAGVQEHAGGLESCARGAYDRDYNVVLLKDCSFGTNPELWEWSVTRVMPYFSRVLTADQVLRLIQ